ncbi:class I SAM-dependent methyltransferase [Streptomyces beijiangensis]|uniref:Methyltransferase domain-containing protein n=1 Tax=Streptomyces beijiangensis TaxID=163361 RepID=A0A939FCF2_9ACTN|nr:methyltransferase domain-containing protein [Streptomyces beijiangensis]MBO0515651.1 methyltransferase domain-containing protein [Streptomyces beijiangensis]
MSPLLPRVLPSPEGKPLPPKDTAEAFRAFARDLAAGRRSWTREAAGFLAGLFDQLASSWDTDQATGRDDPVRDALARGGPFPHGTCLELGSGTGLFTPALATAFTTVISIDLSEQMLRQAAGRSPARVRADAGALPSADASVAVVAAIDMLLFPDEMARVLAPAGVLLWINQLGQDGPLYLPAEDVAAALPGRWTAVEAAAGWGSWAALRRTR